MGVGDKNTLPLIPHRSTAHSKSLKTYPNNSNKSIIGKYVFIWTLIKDLNNTCLDEKSNHFVFSPLYGGYWYTLIPSFVYLIPATIVKSPLFFLMFSSYIKYYELKQLSMQKKHNATYWQDYLSCIRPMCKLL